MRHSGDQRTPHSGLVGEGVVRSAYFQANEGSLARPAEAAGSVQMSSNSDVDRGLHRLHLSGPVSRQLRRARVWAMVSPLCGAIVGSAPA